MVVGLVLGYGGAKLITWAARRTWIVAGGRRLATLGVAISAFAVALAIDGNGFIAAVVAGIAFGAVLDDTDADIERVGELPELGGELLAIEELGETSPVANQAVAAVALTVLLSVAVHGVTAGPGGRRYAQREHTGPEPPFGDAPAC